MKTARVSAFSCAALLAVAATATAGPTAVIRLDLIAPPQDQIEQIHYRRYRHHHHRRYYQPYVWNPGAAIAGTALGLLSFGTMATFGGWCDPYWGPCYYRRPYYYGYYPRPYYYSPYRYAYWW